MNDGDEVGRGDGRAPSYVMVVLFREFGCSRSLCKSLGNQPIDCH